MRSRRQIEQQKRWLLKGTLLMIASNLMFCAKSPFLHAGTKLRLLELHDELYELGEKFSCKTTGVV
jgi:hypothetical protein